MPRPRFLRTEELLESPGFQQKLEGQQAETMRAMEACIDDVFKEIAEGLEVHVDQSQLEEKMRGAVRPRHKTTWVAFFEKEGRSEDQMVGTGGVDSGRV